MLFVIALLVFAVVPGLVVNILFGARFSDATPFVLAVGFIGLGAMGQRMARRCWRRVRCPATSPACWPRWR